MARSRVRTVELQLLRHGPSHNQLLSPLTDYLALCGDHPNTTLNFPLEHDALLVRLRALRYEDSDATRRSQLRETSAIVANLLAEVPGLISELGLFAERSEACVNLSIATGAAELSLVPFELATSPPGFPGPGGALCLQAQLPICLTRRSRNVRFGRLNWDRPVRILLIGSDAGGDIPLERHYTLLRKLIDPWVGRMGVHDSANDEREMVRERLVLLADASTHLIEQAIVEAFAMRSPFTHVHILAHGCRMPDRRDRFGVALHSPPGRTGADAVGGERLGKLLSGRVCVTDAPCPHVVTLAVCDSGQQGGDVTVPGASVALELHEAGIPLVVGSQFPLTFGGSVTLVEALYSRLLDGWDPRECLWETRRSLFAQNAEQHGRADAAGRHDWSSMIAFAALPPDIEAQSRRFEYNQRRRRMEAALAEGDRISTWLRSQSDHFKAGAVDTAAGQRPADTRIREIMQAVDRFDTWLDRAIDFGDSEAIWLYGVAASAEKRVAELVYFWNSWQDVSREYELWESQRDQREFDAAATVVEILPNWQETCLQYLHKSLERYRGIRRHDRNQGWAFVQELFLDRFLSFRSASKHPNSAETLDMDDRLMECWFQAKYICVSQHLDTAPRARERAWHVTNMIELALLRTLIPGFLRAEAGILERVGDDFSERKVVAWLNDLNLLATQGGEAEFAVYTGHRQLLRYRTMEVLLGKNMGAALTSKYEELVRNFGSLYAIVERRIKQHLQSHPQPLPVD